jgi:FixJ family two-component response regulator
VTVSFDQHVDGDAFSTLYDKGNCVNEGMIYSEEPIGTALSSQKNSNLVTVHLVEQDVSLRASIARRLADAGFHAEIYSETREFANFSPSNGIILIDDANHADGLRGMIGDFGQAGATMPIIVYCNKPTIEGVVSAMKANAVNYLSLDVSDEKLVAALYDAFREGEKNRLRFTQAAHSAKLIDFLSPREREVLELLVEGEGNKGIARVLGLSPRTVEIHRMKLMGKLGAKSVAQAVKMWCTANRVA